MGNKINPLGFRLGVNKVSSARWYAKTKAYPALLREDELIREAVHEDVGRAGISTIDIERAAHNINITIHTAKPGVVIGRGGESIKALRTKLDGKVAGTIAVNVQEVANATTNAKLVAHRIAEQLERRFAFRRAMKQAVQRTMEAGAKGVKIRCSGRLGGTEQARPEWYADGRVPLQTLRADIDYGTAMARTTYGIIGVKVWVFHGEIVGDRTRGRAVLPRPRVDEDKRGRRRRPQARRRDGPGGRDGGPGGAPAGGRPRASRARAPPHPWGGARGVARAFIEFFRGTSLLVQLFWFFYVLPLFGIELSSLFTGILALGLNYGAYGAEVVRGALNSVPKGQWEASIALSLSPARRMFRIVWPQAWAIMIPSLSNLGIMLLKGSAVAYVILMHDITFVTNQLRQMTNDTFFSYGVGMVIYFLIAYVLVLIANFAEIHAKNKLGTGPPLRDVFRPRAIRTGQPGAVN